MKIIHKWTQLSSTRDEDDEWTLVERVRVNLGLIVRETPAVRRTGEVRLPQAGSPYEAGTKSKHNAHSKCIRKPKVLGEEKYGNMVTPRKENWKYWVPAQGRMGFTVEH